ncbi:MAG: serine--tRNA ligase, partial [Dehalococcoidales bacterium]|nr:serine--tRNA ligase [Dehalococcoidales bacterium]
MLDLKFIRENTELVRQAIKNRQDTAPLDEILALDGERRQKLLELEELRHQRKEAAREKNADKESGRTLRAAIREREEAVRALDEQIESLLLQLPNIPHPTTPVGKDEGDNPIIRSWGKPKKFDFKPAPHWKLGEDLGIIDFERGVKLS